MSLYLGTTPIADGASTALLAGKADIDLSNLNNTGTATGAGLALPSDTYDDLTLGASGATYTAPANGYFNFYGLSAQQAGGVQFESSVNGMYVGSQTSYASGLLNLLLPVKKGDVITFVYWNGTPTVQKFRFIYAKGSEWEKE